MKRIGLILIAAFGVLIFSACQTTTTTTPPVSTTTTTLTTGSETTTPSETIASETVVDLAYAALDLGDLSALTASSPRIIMPTTIKVLDRTVTVNVSWSISDPDYIDENGVITQPDYETGNVTVTLTATLSYGEATRQKAFSATILCQSSPEDAEPFFREDFTGYANGNIIPQSGGLWSPVSSKSGSSLFTVVDAIAGTAIPGGSKALMVNAFTELQIEAPFVHAYDVVVLEVDLYQTPNCSPIYLQTSSSAPVIGFGVYGGTSTAGRLFYRTDNKTMIPFEVPANTWFRVRLEIDYVAKTIEMFYYDAGGHLISVTDGPYAFLGTVPSSLIIRSGSSTTTALNANPAYVTNFVANRIEAMPRPVEPVKIGAIDGIEEDKLVVLGESFTPAVPVVSSFYGWGVTLQAGVDYSVTVESNVNTAVQGIYAVNYTFTNLIDAGDVVTVVQTVTVYDPAGQNQVIGATSTIAGYVSHLTTVTLSLFRPEGTLYYVASPTPLTAEQILASGNKVSLTVTSATVVLADLVVDPADKLYFLVVLNGNSNVLEHAPVYQTMVPITTPAEFYAALHSPESEQLNKYYLVQNDLDFTGYNWVLAADDFTATLDGGNHTISNLVITDPSPSINGGIIYKLDGGVVRNLILENVSVTARANNGSGLLIGQLYGTTLVENIVFLHCTGIVDVDYSGLSDPSKAASYGGLVAGRIRSGSATIHNIAVFDCLMESRHNYGGGLVGGMETATSATFYDIYLEDFTVKEATDTTIVTGQMVGGIIGRVQGNTSIYRVVAVNLNVIGLKNVGGLIGKSDEPNVTVTIQNVFLNGSLAFTPGDTTHANIIVGNIVDQTPVEFNVFASGFPLIGTNGLAVREGHLVEATATEVLSWWETNLSIFTRNEDWMWAGTRPILDIFYPYTLPEYEVTLDYNMGPEDGAVTIRQGDAFAFVPATVAGFRFLGWFSDAAMTLPLAEGTLVTGPVTFYGKWEAVTSGIVTFDTGEGGPAVPSQNVNFGSPATLPVVADTIFGGVLKKVTGWTLNGVPFDFATLISADITLEAVWETCTYVVTFTWPDGSTTTQTVAYGQTATEPETDPVHPLFTSIVFAAWTAGGLAYDFATPVTAALGLAVSWTYPDLIEVTTLDQFHYVATKENVGLHFVLKNDLDFTGYSWVTTGTSFKGTFDGAGYTIAHLTFTVTTGYGGIFARLNGATLTNIVLDDVSVTNAERAGILFGRIENAACTISNVVIKNSDVTGNNSNGVGALGALVSFSSTVSNITILDSTVTNTANKNVGGVIGRLDKATLTISDVYVSGVTVTTPVSANDDGAGAFIGYLRDDATTILVGTRIVIVNTTVNAENGGAAIGYYRTYSQATITDSYFQVTFANALRASGLIGYLVGVSPIDASTIWGSFTNEVTAASTQALTNAPVIPGDLAWWTTNLPAIPGSALWTVSALGVAKLINSTN